MRSPQQQNYKILVDVEIVDEDALRKFFPMLYAERMHLENEPDKVDAVADRPVDFMIGNLLLWAAVDAMIDPENLNGRLPGLRVGGFSAFRDLEWEAQLRRIAERRSEGEPGDESTQPPGA